MNKRPTMFVDFTAIISVTNKTKTFKKSFTETFLIVAYL